MGMHYMAHRTNLMVQILSHLQMGNKIEGLFQTLYNYFFESLKRHLEFTKPTKLLETKGAKILKNVKTCLILCCLLPDVLWQNTKYC
jgi:hypothetical protein